MNQSNQNDWPRETWKKYPIKVNPNCHEGVTQRLSPWVHQCVYPHVLYSFPLSKYFTCFTTYGLWGILFCKVRGPVSLTTGALTATTQPRLWRGTQALLQIIAGWDHGRPTLLQKTNLQPPLSGSQPIHLQLYLLNTLLTRDVLTCLLLPKRYWPKTYQYVFREWYN